MQKTTTAILAISIAAITVSFIAANGMLPTTFMIAQSNQLPNINDKSMMLGHVTYVVKGPDGNIKAYAQTDNSRTVEGVNCAEQILFNPNNGQKLVTNNTSSACPGMDVRSSTGFNGFNVIGLVNGSSTTAMILNGSDNIATSKIGGTRTGSADGIIVTANQGASAPGTVAGTPTNNQLTITTPEFTFSVDRTTAT